MSTQLEAWKGEFGDAYTDRNIVDWRDRVPALEKILSGRVIRTALEIGCNRGHTLLALEHLGISVTGIEPNPYARSIAQAAGLLVSDGTVYDTGEITGAATLVVCCGVLIHVPSDRLTTAMRELVRVSRRYILSIEYAAETETEVMYHGLPAMLWKRDYGALWSARSDVTLAATGELGPTWDDATYWLLEKR